MTPTSFRFVITVTGALLLAACHRNDGAALAGPAISCRPPGATKMTSDCTVEPMKGPDGTVLTIRHPDGSFRRLLEVKDGRGVIAADGAEPAKVTAANASEIDVAIGGAMYRLPARVTP